SLADAVRHAAGLADANADTPLTIADHNHGAEGEAATALDHFGDALDVDDALIQFFTLIAKLARLALFTLLFRHSLLQPRSLDRLRERLQPARRHGHDTCNRHGRRRLSRYRLPWRAARAPGRRFWQLPSRFCPRP